MTLERVRSSIYALFLLLLNEILNALLRKIQVLALKNGHNFYQGCQICSLFLNRIYIFIIPFFNFCS